MRARDRSADTYIPHPTHPTPNSLTMTLQGEFKAIRDMSQHMNASLLPFVLSLNRTQLATVNILSVDYEEVRVSLHSPPNLTQND